MELMETPKAVAGVFNIGSDEHVTIRELAERVIAAAREDELEDSVSAIRRRLRRGF